MLKGIGAVLSILVSLPITIYLQYKILTMVGATELMWFLFWANVPTVIIIQVLIKFATEEKK